MSALCNAYRYSYRLAVWCVAIILQYVAKVALTIDNQITVGEVKKMLEPFVKLPSNQFIVRM